MPRVKLTKQVPVTMYQATALDNWTGEWHTELFSSPGLAAEWVQKKDYRQPKFKIKNMVRNSLTTEGIAHVTRILDNHLGI